MEPSDSNPLEIYLSTSFVGDLSYQAPANQVAGMAHTSVTGRRTWKTSKGKNEAVWPSHVEAALFDGLEKYRPASSGDLKLLRRFPKRNRFISDHIKKVTGKERTPKQVGSRLQQLRDTCQEEQVLKLLSRREFPPDIKTSFLPDRSRSPSLGPSLSPASSSSTSPSSSPFATEFTDVFSRGLSLLSPQFADRPVSDVYPPVDVIDFLSGSGKGNTYGTYIPHQPEPVYLLEFDLPTSSPHSYIRSNHLNVRLMYSGSLSSIAPSVKILCPYVLPAGAHSLFCVFLDDSLQYNEAADLQLLPGLSANGSAQYGASLVPQFWETICQQPNLSCYTITQDVMLVSIEAGKTMSEAVLCTVSYKFKPLVMKHEYPVDFHTPNIHRLASTPSIYAPRLLLLDTANRLLTASGTPQPTEHVWYNNSGMTVHPAPHSPGFLGVDDAEPLKPLDDITYLSYDWW
ncbi:hypothetical protein DXG01_011350 [Tephrocybe rancida]|nr:hypothetical protein DXG01_011350 [Tephrocybe rancida]